MQVSQDASSQLRTVLQEKDKRIAELEEKLQTHELLLATLSAEKDEVVVERSALVLERDELWATYDILKAEKSKLKKECDTLKETSEEQEEQLRQARDNVSGLEASLVAARSNGFSSVKATYEHQIRKLQNEIGQWTTKYHILSTRDHRTNDEIRRKAALEPELRAEVTRLAGELDRVEEEHAAAQKEIARLKLAVAEEFYVCQYVEDGKHCHEKFHDAEVSV